MKKPVFKTYLIFVLISFLSVKSTKVSASHIAGGEITYVCLGSNQYQVYLNLYWDCTGGFDPGATQTLNLTNTCGGSATLTMYQTNPSGTDVSQTCSTALSSCAGGSIPGINMNTYSGTITLAPCDTWTMSYSTCCRNSAIDNVSGANYYIEATLNSTTALCNSSPYFTGRPIPYICVNQPVNYNYGVIDADRDSLHYSLINAMDGAGVSSTYYAGYSGSSPIPGIAINSSTGTLSFTATAIGNYVVVVMVQDYDTLGNLKGTIMRDIQFIVENCTNTIPDSSGGTITNFTGTAGQTGPNSISLCPGSNFEFDAIFSDSNSADVLTFQSNIASVLPTATITGSGTNPLTLHIVWNSSSATLPSNLFFTITIQDGACPVIGEQSFVYNVNIDSRTNAGADKIICVGQQASLSVTGGSAFVWSVLSGPALTVGSNFSCNNCANPVASPTSTTVYEVVSDLSGCTNRDTITVNVVPDFTFDLLQSASTICLSNSIQFEVANLSPAGAYNYQWSPALYLDNPSIANPTANIPVSGTYNYSVAVTSPTGCIKTDTLDIEILPAGAPQPTIISSDTTACVGATIQLTASMVGLPVTCGTSSIGCDSTFSASIGSVSGVNTATTWPAIYGNWYTSAKHQMLFRASELTSAGLAAGKIDRLEIPVNSISGISTYHQFTIKMGCTSLNSMSTAWVGGLYQVFDPSTVNINVGMNSYLFNNAFEWDGVANIVVEICFYEGPGTSYTQNSLSPFTTTSFNSCLYSYTDATNMCPDLTNPVTLLSNRPVIKFHYCDAIADSSGYTYSWMPTSGLSSPNSQTTNVLISGPTTYTLTVTDTSTGCIGIDSIQMNLCTSVGQIANKEILIYPNPISDLVNISNPKGQAIKYSIYDITGKLVIGTKQSDNSLIQINTSTLGKGLYFLQLDNEDHAKTYKIIKQ